MTIALGMSRDLIDTSTDWFGGLLLLLALGCLLALDLLRLRMPAHVRHQPHTAGRRVRCAGCAGLRAQRRESRLWLACLAAGSASLAVIVVRFVLLAG
ncbi:MAG: hypothetical protein ACR2JO_02125 [Mycobacteriales bacterium]